MELWSEPHRQAGEESPLLDVVLLASALRDAEEARRAGLVIGPAVDEVSLRRSVRRAQRADLALIAQLGSDRDGAA